MVSDKLVSGVNLVEMLFICFLYLCILGNVDFELCRKGR